jgi:ABC-type nickel/cobalt efflux system permease component RcnA
MNRFSDASPTMRLIGFVLLISFIGFLYVSSHSSSHAQLRHSHQASLHHHLDDGHQDGGHDEEAAGEGASVEHTHPHDPLDHTHDIPLRMAIAGPAAPPFFRGWLASDPPPFRSAFPIPLERPPKSPLTV